MLQVEMLDGIWSQICDGHIAKCGLAGKEKRKKCSQQIKEMRSKWKCVNLQRNDCLIDGTETAA